MVLSSLIGGGCNYLFQLFMGRMLGPEEYGIFGSLFAISYMIYILSQTIQTSGAKFISKYIGENREDEIVFFVRGLLSRMLILGSGLYFLFIISSNYISNFLKIGSLIPIYILGSIFIFSSLLPVNLGVLQGIERFGALGVINIINFSTKLIIGIILVWIGLSVNGALLAVVFGFIIALFFSFIPIRKYMKKKKNERRFIQYKKFYIYSLPTMVAMLCLSVPANIDVILVKHLFETDLAGFYTAATVLGKIIIFITTGITLATFPKISKLFEEKKDTTKLLNVSLFYTGVLSGFAAIGYWFFPNLIIKLLFGVEYLDSVSLLKWYGLSMFFFSLVIVLIRYNLAIQDMKYVILLSSFTIAEIILWWFYNNTVLSIVMILFYMNIILFVVSYAYTIIKKNVNHKLIKPTID